MHIIRVAIQFILVNSKTGDGPTKESLLKDSLATAKLWEVRYNAAELSRKEYRQVSLETDTYSTCEHTCNKEDNHGRSINHLILFY